MVFAIGQVVSDIDTLRCAVFSWSRHVRHPLPRRFVAPDVCHRSGPVRAGDV